MLLLYGAVQCEVTGRCLGEAEKMTKGYVLRVFTTSFIFRPTVCGYILCLQVYACVQYSGDHRLPNITLMCSHGYHGASVSQQMCAVTADISRSKYT